MHINLLTH